MMFNTAVPQAALIRAEPSGLGASADSCGLPRFRFPCSLGARSASPRVLCF
jgi:hypothetical protein